ncbi:hypothetical protein NGM44_10330 [Moraxella sp. FZFQ2102]|uniref:hypothetical protein n=1 Tax=Moraxella sp. FZFQ2102 TaxID=2953752 RepID=UPI00209C1993|nr:hypothetical protein [Moraxella sp. FZFQ2102]USZ14731.1 hypothetical protein NGM44_10330 [Moraxella sp. FZFQ2102]
MMIRLLFALMVFIIGVMGLQACHADSPPKPLPQEVTLHFGHQGVKDNHRYLGYSETAGSLSFDRYHWQPPNLGIVKLEHFGKTTTIPHVFSIFVARHGERTDGVGGMGIQAGLSQAEFTTAEQAYQDYVALITAFKQAGWQQYFRPWDARIAKEDNVKILTYDNPDDVPDDRYVFNTRFSSDSLTPLTFEEWQYVIAKQEKDGYGFVFNLNLYLRDVTVWINIQKTDTKPNPIPNQPDLEQYMVDFHFKTAKYEFYRNIVDEETVEQLRQVYEEWRNWGIESRQDDEAKAKNAGFSINESYQDPDMWQYIIEPAY